MGLGSSTVSAQHKHGGVVRHAVKTLETRQQLRAHGGEHCIRCRRQGDVEAKRERQWRRAIVNHI